MPAPAAAAAGKIPAGGIDCDIHPAAPDMKALLPYLDDYWRETVVTRGIDVQRAWALSTAFSDHLPIAAELRLPDSVAMNDGS